MYRGVGVGGVEDFSASVCLGLLCLTHPGLPGRGRRKSERNRRGRELPPAKPARPGPDSRGGSLVLGCVGL